jgi:plastocyanin
MLRRIIFAASLIGVGACGGNDAKTPDAAPQPGVDAAPATVQMVACAGITPAATITANDPTSSFTPPATTITQGQIAAFTVAGDHPVGPDAAAGLTDSGLKAPGGATTCLKFTATGTFHFKCTIHQFKGTITVN